MVVVVVTLPRDVGRIGATAWPVVDIELVLVDLVDEGVELEVKLVEEPEVLIELDRDVEVVGVLLLVEVDVVDVLVLVVGEAVTVGFTMTVDVVLKRPDSISKPGTMQRSE